MRSEPQQPAGGSMTEAGSEHPPEAIVKAFCLKNIIVSKYH